MGSGRGVTFERQGRAVMATIAFASEKGGAGKTSSIVGLGTALAGMGKRVCWLDLDPQHNLTTALGGEFAPEPGWDIGAVLMQQTALDAERGDVSDLERVGEIVITKVAENLDLIPANKRSLLTAETTLQSNPAVGLFRLGEVLAAIEPLGWDYVLIDTPGKTGHLMSSALMATRWVVVTATPDKNHLNAMAATLDQVQVIQRRRPELGVLGTLLVKNESVTNTTKVARELFSEVSASYEVHEFRVKIPADTKFREAEMLEGVLGELFPLSRSAIAYRDLAVEVEELLGQAHAIS